METTTGQGAGAGADPWQEVVGRTPAPSPALSPPAGPATPMQTMPVPIAPRPPFGPQRPAPGGRRRVESLLKVAVAVLALAVLGAAVALVVVHLRHVGPSGHRPAPRSGALRAAPSTTAPAPASTTAPPPAAPAPVLSASGGSLPSAITDPSTVAAATVASLPLYPSPGAPAPTGHLANPNWLGARLTLLVTAVQGAWVQAYVPVRPNESTAWVPAADVALSSDPFHIQVSLSAHRLVLYKDNAPVFSAPVATGAPGSPTPTGSFFVAFIVKLTDPWNVYGPYALGTSDFSNTYFSFEGGPGQIGIHGTNQPWVIGSYASHGCIRLDNTDITTLASQIVPGTPVEVGP